MGFLWDNNNEVLAELDLKSKGQLERNKKNTLRDYQKTGKEGPEYQEEQQEYKIDNSEKDTPGPKSIKALVRKLYCNIRNSRTIFRARHKGNSQRY